MSVAGQFVAGDVRAGKTKPTTNNKTKLEVRLPVKTGDRTSLFLPALHPICVENQRPGKTQWRLGMACCGQKCRTSSSSPVISQRINDNGNLPAAISSS